LEKLNRILEQIPNLNYAKALKKISDTQLKTLQVIIILSGFLLAALNKSNHIFLTLTYLLLTSLLPLLLSFEIYFVGQHSMHGWLHLATGLKEGSFNLRSKSLPFSFAGAILILYFLLFAGPSYVVVFFIILSCMSIPHVFSMHRFYAKVK